LSNRVTLMWPVRPNDSTVQQPTSYHVYWDTSSAGPFTKLIADVPNASQDAFNIRSYHNKVVLNFYTNQVPGWDNTKSNYVLLKAVVGGAEQAAEAVVAILPYTTSGMRLRYPEVRTTVIAGYNAAEERFIPVTVDTTGKLL